MFDSSAKDMEESKKEKYNNYMKTYMLRRYHSRMTEAKKILGGKCVECGSVENLEFDHIDRKKKSFTISQLWSIT